MSRKELTTIHTQNKDIVTSFVYTWARQKEMSILEQRVVLRIMEYASNHLKGIKLKDHLHKIDLGLFNVTITMPASDVLFNTKMKHHDIEKALYALRSRSFEYRDDNRYTVCGFINNATYVYRSGMITVEVDNRIWDVLSDFTLGFKRFELNKALALPTSSALQFYMIMSGQERPLRLSIAELKNWLGIPADKYTKDGKDRIDHLEERVLRPVKRMLDDTCPYTFTYEKIRQNPSNCKSPVVGFELIPVYQEKFRDQELERVHLTAKVSLGFISPQVTNYMKHQMGFSKDNLNPHKELLIRAVKILPDIMKTLEDIQGRRRTKTGETKGIGWVIQAIRGEVSKAEKASEKSGKEG